MVCSAGILTWSVNGAGCQLDSEKADESYEELTRLADNRRCSVAIKPVERYIY